MHAKKGGQANTQRTAQLALIAAELALWGSRVPRSAGIKQYVLLLTILQWSVSESSLNLKHVQLLS